MTDALNTEITNSSHPDFKWFAAAAQEHPRLLQYFDALAHAPRKVDLLLRADEAMAVTQGDLLERLARHPKLGMLIVYGVPQRQRLLIRARAAALGLQVRFCESKEELNVLVNKRRSRAMLDISTIPLISH